MSGMDGTTKPMPYDKRDGDSGRFSPSYTDEEFIGSIRHGGAVTTSEVADAVGCEYRTAYERLNRLEDQGRVSSRKPGNTLLWRLGEE